jgi:hypothetical protein
MLAAPWIPSKEPRILLSDKLNNPKGIVSNDARVKCGELAPASRGWQVGGLAGSAITQISFILGFITRID